jgi:hypothetical protein
MGGDYPDYCKKVVVVYEGTITGGEVLVDHRKILGIALKTPTFPFCIPTSIENAALAYDAVTDRFKVDVQAMTIGTIDANITDKWTRQLGQIDLARVLGSALAHANPVISRLTDGSAFIDPRTIRALTSADIVSVIESAAAGLKVDIKTDTLGGLKVLEKNATGVKFDLVTDTLGGLKVVEKNATGVKFDLVTDTLAGLKVLEKNATGVKVDLVTDTLAGLKVYEKNATGIKVDITTDTLAGLKVTQATRTNLLAKPEREDLTSLGGSASPNNAGVQIIAPNGTKKIKVYDASYCGGVDGNHCFYFGTSTVLTTKRFLSRNKLGVMSKTFVQPRVSDASDGLYIYASVNESGGMLYDIGYVQE